MGPKVSKCSACGANIIWLRTPKGKSMPADYGLVRYKENPEGKGRVVDDWGRMIKCDLEFEGPASGMARIPHWATCPHAKQFKKK